MGRCNAEVFLASFQFMLSRVINLTLKPCVKVGFMRACIFRTYVCVFVSLIGIRCLKQRFTRCFSSFDLDAVSGLNAEQLEVVDIDSN